MPPASFSFRSTSDPAEAKRWFAGLIEREPVALSIVGSVTEGLIEDPSRFDDPRWWAGVEDDAVVAAYMHSPPHPLHVAWSTAQSAEELATSLVAEGYPAQGVGGLRGPAMAFAGAWCRLTGARSRVAMETASFDLPERAVLPFEVRGELRHARADQLGLVDGWMQDFHDEATPDGPPPNSLAPHVDDCRVALWVVDGAPVSMAFASRAAGGVTRISGVWTPPDLRGNGYASAVVAALSNERIDRGERCMLYTDLANPTSNAIYQALGYRRVGDSVTIRFT
jgi:GNAT superfamily N-acetyltransferase